MTYDQIRSDENFVKSWRETIEKNETVKTVLGAMDESSPINIDPDELKEQSAESKYWFFKGYAFYHKRLTKDLPNYASKPKVLRATYQEQ